MLEREEQKGGREDEIEDENKVRREDEIEALQAIYDGAMDVNRGQVPGMDVVLTFHVCYRLKFFMPHFPCMSQTNVLHATNKPYNTSSCAPCQCAWAERVR